MKTQFVVSLTIFLCIGMLVMAPAVQAATIVADHTVVSEFESIPASYIEQAKDNFRMFYGHTSHGNQIIAGMNILRIENSLYGFNLGSGTLPGTFNYDEISSDLGGENDFWWMNQTRVRLEQPLCDRNIVMWSFCGGMSWHTETTLNKLCDSMSLLETEYPNVTFIYQTGHLDGTGTGGNLWQRNDQLRAFCSANNKVLFDFADIESYDPDGTLHADNTGECEWCYNWCTPGGSHDCPLCEVIGCSHSHDFNCYQKGKAFWWLLSTLAGWSLALDVDPDQPSSMPKGFNLKQNYPNPFNPETKIRFTLATGGHCSLEVYNVTGRKVATLVDEFLSAREHTVTWDGCDDNQQSLASGVYFYRLDAGDQRASRKMVLLR